MCVAGVPLKRARAEVLTPRSPLFFVSTGAGKDREHVIEVTNQTTAEEVVAAVLLAARDPDAPLPEPPGAAKRAEASAPGEALAAAAAVPPQVATSALGESGGSGGTGGAGGKKRGRSAAGSSGAPAAPPPEEPRLQ